MNMAIKVDLQKFKELLNIQKERQLILQELSEELGYDVSFSDDEVMQFAEEEYAKYIQKEVTKEVSVWMKSVFS